jgi:hypothetical protein
MNKMIETRKAIMTFPLDLDIEPRLVDVVIERPAKKAVK